MFFASTSRAYLLVLLVASACSTDSAGTNPAMRANGNANGATPDAGASGGDGMGGSTTGTGVDAETDAAPSELPPPGRAFPKGFVFGSAIAGFQSDMGCPTLPPGQCDDPNSDWYVFTTSPVTVNDDNAHLSGQNPSVVSPGFWELAEEDIARANEDMHHNGLRFSIEWSRIFPNPTDDVEGFAGLKAASSEGAVRRYHAMLDALRARGMRPLVTINHYSLPSWIHDAAGCHTNVDTCSPRGWLDRDRTLREIVKFASFCAEEFGADVDWWATLNEPLQNMLFGYVQPSEQRSHPPAVRLAIDEAKVVFNALIDAHARIYDAIKLHDTVDADEDGAASFVGVVYPLVPIEPKDPGSANDRKAADNIDYLWNRAYLNAVALGKYDPKMDRNTVTRDDLVGRMDYIGVNYYFGMKVSSFLFGAAVPILSGLSPLFTANPLDFQEIPNDPTKLEGFIRWVNQDLGLPVVITENGAVDPDDDGTGPRFLVQNLHAIQQAIENGADVRGYFYWTLTDNYESFDRRGQGRP